MRARETEVQTLFSDTLSDKKLSEFISLQATLLKGFLRRGYIPVDAYFRLLPLPENRRYDAAVSRSHQIVESFVAERHAEDRARDDVLSLLMHARTEDDNQVMSDQQQVSDEMITLMMAGTDTTAAMAWMFHAFATQPDVARRAYGEVDATFQQEDPPTAHSLLRLGLPQTSCQGDPSDVCASMGDPPTRTPRR